MKKKIFSLILAFCLILPAMFLVSACGDDKSDELTNQTNTEVENKENENIENQNDIVKVTGGADEVGIYSIVVELKSGAADQGVIELVYKGPKGTPQEESVVNTFRIEYCKEDTGTYKIETFYDGAVYRNYKDKTTMKVTNTFGATVRAGDVTISYTPNGGTTQKIYTATAEQFRK